MAAHGEFPLNQSGPCFIGLGSVGASQPRNLGSPDRPPGPMPPWPLGHHRARKPQPQADSAGGCACRRGVAAVGAPAQSRRPLATSPTAPVQLWEGDADVLYTPKAILRSALQAQTPGGAAHLYTSGTLVSNVAFFIPVTWPWVEKTLRCLWVFSNICKSPDLTVTSIGILCLNYALGPIYPRYETLNHTVSECSIYHNYPSLLLSPFVLSYTSTLNQHRRLQLSIHLWAHPLQAISSDIARSAIVLTIFVVHFSSFRRRCKLLLLRRPMHPVVMLAFFC